MIVTLDPNPLMHFRLHGFKKVTKYMILDW